MNNFLFVCSANVLRSPTCEHVARLHGFSADSVGCDTRCNPVRVLTIESMQRAERIVCMEEHHRQTCLALNGGIEGIGKLEVWNIPDIYNYCEPQLIAIVQHKLMGR